MRPPPDNTVGRPSWLDDVERFRARVLFDGGRRPSFRASDGSYLDMDPVDGAAHHVVASAGGRILGTFRVLPLAGGGTGMCERLLDSDGVQRLLDTLGRDRQDLWEGGGWVVDPEHQGTGLGIRLLATGVAVAERFGYPTVIGAAGVRYGQYRMLAKLGYRQVPGFDVFPVDKLADDVCIVHADTRGLRAPFRALVAQADAHMRLRSR